MSQTSQLNARASANQGAETYRPSVLDRIIAAGARALRFIPAPLLSVFSRTNNSGDRLDGDVALSLLSLKVVGGPDIADQTAVDARRDVDRQAYLAGSGGTKSLEVGLVDHRIIDGVRVRVYTPAGAARWQGGKPAPAIIYMHGGGWATGSLDSHDSTCRFLCRRSSVQVYSIDYRMAPEHPFPASLEDATTVISAAVSGQVPEIDPAQVIIAGDSAGAHLATASTLWLRDRGLPQPALQMLFAPIVDLRTSPRTTSAGTTRPSSVSSATRSDGVTSSPRSWPRTCPGSPRPMSPSPAMTRCVTKVRPTPPVSMRPGCR